MADNEENVATSEYYLFKLCAEDYVDCDPCEIPPKLTSFNVCEGVSSHCIAIAKRL